MIPTLELSDIVVGVDRRAGGRGLTLEVAPGEVVAVCGPPRFGGTAFCRVVAGHAPPVSGLVKLDGRDLTAVGSADRPIGFVPVDGGLLPQLTLADNITYGARLADMPNEILRRRLDRLVERLELLPSLSLRPHEVSAGQRTRGALARAALRRTGLRALVVDATAGFGGVTGLRRLIARVTEELTPMPVVIFTRYADVVGQADRLVWVDNGQVRVDEPIARLRDTPPNLPIAELTAGGPTAKVAALVQDGGIDLAGLRLDLPEMDGRRVIALLTTESIEAFPHPGGEPSARVLTTGWHDGVVHLLVEPLSRLGERWPARAGSATYCQPQDRVALRLHPRHVAVFDESTLAPVTVGS